jgi:hypothetical protein
MLWWPKNKTKSATNEKVILPPRKRLPWVKTKTISATNDLVDRCGISVSQNDHRICKSKDKHNGQKKKDKGTNKDLQSIHIKLKIK